MKRAPLKQAGFTIVETIIFISVTGILLASALLIFNGRIGRAEFTQSVQAFDNQIKSTINEVASGTYPTSPPFSCTVDAVTGAPKIAGTARAQGTNTDCIFLGKVLQPGVGGQDGCAASALKKCTNLNIYTMVGRRALANGEVVTTLAGANGAQPRLVDLSAANITDYEKLGYNMYVKSIKDLSKNTTIGAIGILQSLGSTTSEAGVNRLNSGIQLLQTWPVASGFPKTQTEIDAAVNNNAVTFAPGMANPDKGIVICLLSGTSDQKASITLGSNGGLLTTNVLIGEDAACN